MVSPLPPLLAEWASLPSDLQQLILAHLPPSHQSRLRSVNRSWLSILSSPPLRDLHRRLHPRARPSFLLYNHSVSISVCTWPLVADNSAAAADADADASPAPAPSWSDLTLPAPFVREWVSANSLVCIRNHLTSNAFSVGCPLSNQWKALPNPPAAPLLSKLWAMVPHTSTNSSDMYHVLLLQLNTPSLYIDVFDSEKNSWTQRTVPPKGAGKGALVAFSSSAACIGGLVYSIQTESRSVVTYDVQRDVWKTLEAKLPENLVFQAAKQGGLIQLTPQVMRGCKGKVLLVGAAAYNTLPSAAAADAVKSRSGDIFTNAVNGNDNGDADAKGSRILVDCVGSHDSINYAVVWELDWSCKEWREMARAPSHMCMHMLEEAMESRKAALTPVKYSGHAELVVVMSSGSQRALQFDAIEEKWAWLDLPPSVNCELALCH